MFWLAIVAESLLQAVIEALVKANIDCTIVINGLFFGYMCFSKLASPSSMSPVRVFAGSNTQADLVAEDDVGLVVAKAVTDSRTANKIVAILANALT